VVFIGFLCKALIREAFRVSVGLSLSFKGFAKAFIPECFARDILLAPAIAMLLSFIDSVIQLLQGIPARRAPQEHHSSFESGEIDFTLGHGNS
jgi:hypothetical protein